MGPSTESDYWDKFYFSWEEPVPSQFAVLVAGSFTKSGVTIFDFGCGNGRDSLFFHKYGFTVASSDRSSVAIANLEKKFNESNNAPRFNVVDYGIDTQFMSYLVENKAEDSNSLFYARFLLHAFDAKSLEVFLGAVSKAAQPGDILAFEFRTGTDDRLSGKATPDHFRRGVEIHEVMRYFNDDRFKVLLTVEGFGFAIYKSDNAHVARLVLEVL